MIHDYSVRQLAACIVMEDDDDINSLSVHKRAEAMDYLFGTLIKAVEPESK